uniref:(California timema) hypothetical protein n=1 Tax=Timema californicum TaxID=61474 RepID=A0A7R9IZW6_TIMCA|nr:unnamed protein product [Timema californicum]
MERQPPMLYPGQRSVTREANSLHTDNLLCCTLDNVLSPERLIVYIQTTSYVIPWTTFCHQRDKTGKLAPGSDKYTTGLVRIAHMETSRPNSRPFPTQPSQDQLQSHQECVVYNQTSKEDTKFIEYIIFLFRQLSTDNLYGDSGLSRRIRGRRPRKYDVGVFIEKKTMSVPRDMKFTLLNEENLPAALS